MELGRGRRTQRVAARETFPCKLFLSSCRQTFRYYSECATATRRKAAKETADRITRLRLIPRASMFAQARVKREHRASWMRPRLKNAQVLLLFPCTLVRAFKRTHTVQITYIQQIQSNFLTTTQRKEGGTRDAIKELAFTSFTFTLRSYSSGNRTVEVRETSEIAIERMTEQKRKARGGNCRRGDPAVINGTLRSMRKHYVIHGGHIHGRTFERHSTRSPPLRNH